MQLWRIYRTTHGPGLDGVGGLFTGGRWSQRGHRVVYFSDTPALAVLEKLVHLDPEFIDDDYLLGVFEIDIDVALIENLMQLPMNWIGGDVTETAACGARWLAGGSQALLSVPSAIVPEQRNFLLNPVHRDTTRLRRKQERPFRFDVRLPA